MVKDLDLFEGQYAIPNGVSYNSYVILDDQVAVLDTVDKRKTEEFLANLERELQGRSVDYLVVNHSVARIMLPASVPLWSAFPRFAGWA